MLRLMALLCLFSVLSPSVSLASPVNVDPASSLRVNEALRSAKFRDCSVEASSEDDVTIAPADVRRESFDFPYEQASHAAILRQDSRGRLLRLSFPYLRDWKAASSLKATYVFVLVGPAQQIQEFRVRRCEQVPDLITGEPSVKCRLSLSCHSN